MKYFVVFFIASVVSTAFFSKTVDHEVSSFNSKPQVQFIDFSKTPLYIEVSKIEQR